MSEIPTRVLGATGLDVTALSYGAMELRGEPKGRHLDEGQVGRILHTVLDSGINLIDTSIDYGVSEERVGRHLGARRDEYLLASKCGCLVGAVEDPTATRGVGPHDYGRENLIAGVEQSLRRLRTDHLDILQVHISPSVEVLRAEGVVETLEDLRGQGKVRYIGMSGTKPHLREQIELGVFEVFQIPYSLVQPQHGEEMSLAAAAGAGVIVRGGAARGVPSGGQRATERNPELVDVWRAAGLDDLLEGLSPMELTLRYTLAHPAMTTTIVGTTNPDHLAANVEAASAGPLPADRVAEIDARVAAVLDQSA